MTITEIMQVIDAVQTQKAYSIIFETRPGVTYFSGNDIWLYDPREDDVTCEICRNIADQASLMGGFNGNSLRALFPFWEIIDENTIQAHAHMPRDDNCRCFLNRYIDDPKDRVSAQRHFVPKKLEPEKKINMLPTGNRKKMDKVKPKHKLETS